MTGPSSSPLWRILCAPFTRRTWAELAYSIVSALLDVGALLFILPMLVNGLLWGASSPGSGNSARRAASSPVNCSAKRCRPRHGCGRSRP